MSGSKFNKFIFIAFIICFIFCAFVSYYKWKKIGKQTELIHTISIYSAEGDTILNMDTEADCIKVWIEENGELDVWTSNEDGGWIRK
jgi:hypothetical protein